LKKETICEIELAKDDFESHHAAERTEVKKRGEREDAIDIYN